MFYHPISIRSSEFSGISTLHTLLNTIICCWFIVSTSCHFSATVAENTASGPVVTVTATDADDAATNDNVVISYAIDSKDFIELLCLPQLTFYCTHTIAFVFDRLHCFCILPYNEHISSRVFTIHSNVSMWLLCAHLSV